jgi:hypothetical protein
MRKNHFGGRIGALILALAALAVAACSSPGSAPLPSPRTPPAGSKHAAAMRLSIKVPPRVRGRRKHGRPRYVSPATASLSYAIDGGSPVSVPISTSNPACSVTGAIGYLQCDVTFNVSPGAHTFSFSTFDAQSRLLSANTSVSYNVRVGMANQIPVTLGGVAASLALVFPVAGQLAGNPFSGLTLYGPNPIAVSVLPVDADGAYIIGPGAPQPSLSVASATVGTPAPYAPNLWTISNTTPEILPTAATSTSIDAVASPVPDSGGSSVSTSVSLQLEQPWIYVANLQPSGGSITFYDALGNVAFISSDASFPGVASPIAIAYDPASQELAVANSTGGITAYNFTGFQNPSTTIFPGASDPVAIAFDPTVRRYYVANPSSILEYDASGNPLSASGSFSLPGTPTAVAAFGDVEYVACGTAGVATYVDGNNISQPGNFSGLQNAAGIALDSHNNLVYVVDRGAHTVLAFSQDGDPVAMTGLFPGLNDPVGIAYDATQDQLYVTDQTAGKILAFDPEGNARSIATFPNLNHPAGIVVIP